MIDLTQTEEIACSICSKPLMFTEVSAGSCVKSSILPGVPVYYPGPRPVTLRDAAI